MLGLWWGAAALGLLLSQVLSHRAPWVQWYSYLLVLTIAAFVSQVAEWVHLEVMKHQPAILASLFALSFAVAEYFMSVPAQRLGFRLTGKMYLVNLIWGAAQLLTSYLVLWISTQQAPDWRAWLGMALALASALVQLL